MNRQDILSLVRLHPHQWYHELGCTPLQWLFAHESALSQAIQIITKNASNSDYVRDYSTDPSGILEIKSPEGKYERFDQA